MVTDVTKESEGDPCTGKRNLEDQLENLDIFTYVVINLLHTS
jgi:hypothetical protein